MACNNLQPLLVRPSWCDNWFQQDFSEKKHIQFSPQFSRGFLRDSFPFASVVSPFFSRLQGSYRHRSVRQRLRGAKGPGTESHRRAGGTARPQETGPARFFWTSTGPTAVDFSGDFELRKSWRSDMIRILDRKWWIDFLVKSPQCGVGKYFKVQKK